MSINESHVEQAALEWLRGLGYTVLHGPDIAPETPGAERADYGDVLLAGRLRTALRRINPDAPAAALDEAVKRVDEAALGSHGLVERNRRFHALLTDGVDVEIPGQDGQPAFVKVWLIDRRAPENNDFAAVNQLTIIENSRAEGTLRRGDYKVNRRPDIVIFVNGIPLGVIELKNAADENATVKTAFKQLETYKAQLPALLTYNAVLVISDGIDARAGSLSADFERFQPWRTEDGDAVAEPGTLALKTLVVGIFEKRRLVDLVSHFIVFEADGRGGHIKKMAAYHQFHAVNKAVACTVEAAGERGDRRAGVVWHTQGSGKSLSMVFYAGKLVRSDALANPTVVVLTDRNDLDDQLFGTFAACAGLLRQSPVQAESREHLRELLRAASGGVIFTTLQKFAPDARGMRYPMLSDRRNIVVVADEAHRSHYAFEAQALRTGELSYGFAQHIRDALPYASFIGFTGTPIEATDRSTRKVFGDYIDIYDIKRAVEDGATVPLYYEARLAKLVLDDQERPHIDDDFDEITEALEDDARRKIGSKWARTEALVGAPNRLKQVARDIVEHFETRREAMDGKGMVVCMSRGICVSLYEEIVALRPEWASDDESSPKGVPGTQLDKKGFLKVIMTGSAADGEAWQKHIRTKQRRSDLAETYKDPDSPFKLAIVRDMWLTGFDAPCMHTMYIDKPMCGHGLMQAIARVNRVFRDKPGGLIVDYLGIAERLKQAMSDYTAGDREQVAVPIDRAIKEMQEKYEVVAAMLHGFDYSLWETGTAAQRLALIPAAMELIQSRDPKEGITRFVNAVILLTRKFALAIPEDAALAIREDVAFFHAIRAGFVKTTVTGGRTAEDVDVAVRQIVSKAIVSTEIVDIFRAAGLKSPDISLVSGEFLKEIQGMKQKNVALEFLRKLLNDEIKSQAKTNVMQARLFSERLDEAIRKYQNRAIDAAEVVTELLDMAKDINAARARNEELGLTQEELAFYDALGANDSAVQALGDENLRIITRALVACVHENATIDWSVKENVRANMRRLVRRILRKYGYPPDKSRAAVENIIAQAEALTASVVE